MNSKTSQPEPWFTALMENCLGSLYLLSLDGCPAGDMVGKTARLWIRLLWDKPRSGWDEALDAERIRKAFASMADTCKRWPSPAVFWEHLQPRPVAHVGSTGQLPPDWGREREAEAMECRARWLRDLGRNEWGEVV